MAIVHLLSKILLNERPIIVIKRSDHTMKLPNKATTEEITNDTPKSGIKHKYTVKTVDETIFPTFVQPYVKRDKYIKYIERLIRSSYEYKTYIGILKNDMDLTQCRFIKEADIVDSPKISLEMHHYPYTLYELVAYHMDYIENTEDVAETYNPFRIAYDIMKMHYEGKVGLVPLSLSAHELVHEGELFIPLTSEYVFGNWEEGTEQLLLNDDAKSHLDLLKKLTKKYIDSGKTLDVSILDDIQLRVQMKNELRPKIIHQEKDDDQHNIA